MSDADSEFRIKATIDASGADAGADQVAGDLDQIKGKTDDAAASTEKGATGFNKMATEAGRMRESTRLARELFEVMQGGDASIAGLSGIARYALIASEALGPAGPIVGALAALGLGFVSVWALHEDKSKEAKEKVVSDLGDQQDAVDRFKTALEALLKPQHDLEDSDARRLATIKAESEETTKQIALDKEAAIEKARTAYLLANAEATTEEQRKKLKDQFDAVKKDIESGSTVATAENKFYTAGRDTAGLQKSLSDLQADKAANDKRLAEAQGKEQAGRDALMKMGITPGEDGKLPDDWQKNLQAKLEEAEAVLKGLKEKGLLIAASQTDPFGTAQKENSRQQDDALTKVYAARDALAASQNTAPEAAATMQAGIEAQKTLLPLVKKQADDIDKMTTDLATAQSDLKDSIEGLATAYKTRANDLLEAQTQPFIEASKAEPERVKKIQEADDTSLRATQEAHRQAGQQVTQAESADEKALRESIEQTRGQIEAMRQQELIQKMHQILETVLDKHLELVELHALLTDGIEGRFKQIEEAHYDLDGRVKRLSSP